MKIGMGKTYQLIKRSHDTKAVIVCSDIREVRAMSMEMGLSIPNPVSYHDFIHRYNETFAEKDTPGLLIDNADLLLEMLSRSIPVLAITLRAEE